MTDKKCWACDCTEDIVHTDILGLHWCQTCFEELYT